MISGRGWGWGVKGRERERGGEGVGERMTIGWVKRPIELIERD